MHSEIAKELLELKQEFLGGSTIESCLWQYQCYKWLKAIVNLVMVSISSIKEEISTINADETRISQKSHSTGRKSRSGKSIKRRSSANISNASRLDMGATTLTPHDVFQLVQQKNLNFQYLDLKTADNTKQSPEVNY